MSATPVAIIGAGGVGREVLDILDVTDEPWATVETGGGYEFVGFLTTVNPTPTFSTGAT